MKKSDRVVAKCNCKEAKNAFKKLHNLKRLGAGNSMVPTKVKDDLCIYCEHYVVWGKEGKTEFFHRKVDESKIVDKLYPLHLKDFELL